MPSYDFKNIKTGEVKEYIMSIKDLDKFKEDNPDLIQQITSLRFSTNENMFKKAGDGWKEVQDRIKSGMPPRERHRIKQK